MKNILLFYLICSPFLNFSQQILSAEQFIDGTHCKLTQVKTDHENNFYVAGYFTGTTNFNPAGRAMEVTADGSRDIFIAKYDVNNKLVWMNQIRQQNKFANTWSFLDIDKDGNVIVGGSFEKGLWIGTDEEPTITTFGREDIYLLKMDHTGRTAWWRHVGGIHMDKATCVETNDAGDIFITGHFSGPMDFDPGKGRAVLDTDNKNAFFAKYSADGVFQWVKQISEDHNEGSTPPQLAIGNTGNIILAGQFNGSPDFDPGENKTAFENKSQNANIYVASYTASGDLVWVKNLNVKGYSPYSTVTALTVSAEKIFLTGWILLPEDFNNLEDEVRNKTFVACLDLNGTILWQLLFEDSNENFGTGINANEKGEVFVAGGFRGFLNLPNGLQLVAEGTDGLLVKINSEGKVLDALKVGENSEQYFESSARRADGKMIAVGTFTKWLHIDSKEKPVIYVESGNTYFPLVVVFE